MLWPFFNWIVWVFLVLSFVSFSRILDINPLSNVFVNMAFRYMGCLILFMVCFAMQLLRVGCFQYLAIVNCAAMNIGMKRFFRIGVS